MPTGRTEKLLYITFIVLFVAFAIWLATLDLEGPLAQFVARYGYLGYFISASIAGINVFVPTTHLVFTAPLLNAGLDPWILAACGALGASLADLVGYCIGDRGRHAFTGATERIARWLTHAVERRPRLAPVVLFVWAATVPLPNEILVIPAGVMGYGIVRTFLYTLAGNICFNVIAIQLGLFIF
jgi:membrane protein YqaA with SNARE-associated domain